MDEQIKERFEKLYTGLIYDTVKFDLKKDNFVIPQSAGPIIPSWGFKGCILGRAFTALGAKTSKPDETVIRKMIDDLEDGSVYLLQANDNSRAHFGDITASFLKRAGIEGAIIQGWTRDVKKIEDLDFKLWCKGVQPQDSFDRWHIQDYNCEIVIGNIFINTSNFIFADRDGILVLEEEDLPKILELAEKRLEKENKIRHIVNNTQLTSKEIYESIGRW